MPLKSFVLWFINNISIFFFRIDLSMVSDAMIVGNKKANIICEKFNTVQIQKPWTLEIFSECCEEKANQMKDEKTGSCI